MGRHRLVRGERREVKHLSTCRKRYSVSSGERKRRMAKPAPCDTPRGLRRRGCGSACPGIWVPGDSHKSMCEGNRIEFRAGEGDGPVPVGAWTVQNVSQVVRDSRNPVRIRPDRGVSLNTTK